MPERDKLFGTKLKHKGIFDFKETYRILFEWLVDEGYDVNEKGYKEVVGAGGAKELEIKWIALKKISDYFRFMIEIDFHPLGMTDVEVEIDGVKQKMQKGLFEVKAQGILLKDYEERWTGNAFFKFLRSIYDKFIIPNRINEYEGKLIGEVDEFVAQAKSFLNLTGKR